VPDFLDDAEIDLSCPTCRREFQETLGRLKGNPNVARPGCGGIIAINFDEARKGLDGANRALADPQKAVDRI
jgi:hypothetical protein